MLSLYEKVKSSFDLTYGNIITIGHCAVLDRAITLKEMLPKDFPEAKIIVDSIGPVIGAHTGPGLLAAIYWGNHR